HSKQRRRLPAFLTLRWIGGRPRYFRHAGSSPRYAPLVVSYILADEKFRRNVEEIRARPLRWSAAHVRFIVRVVSAPHLGRTDVLSWSSRVGGTASLGCIGSWQPGHMTRGKVSDASVLISRPISQGRSEHPIYGGFSTRQKCDLSATHVFAKQQPHY